MAVAWFVAPYKRRNPGEVPAERYCAVDDFTEQIGADSGSWSETEILGDCALVKVRASDATLAAINAAPGMLRFPSHVALTDTLGDLTNAQKTVILNRLLTMGYTQAEINAALPNNWQAVTLGQVLRFAAQRRLKPRYDADADAIVLDGAAQPVRDIDDVATTVQ